MFTGNSMTYDLISSAAQAFGSNITQVNTSPMRFAFFSGDVNQDGAIDLTDLTHVFNDASSFSAGYLLTDLTGDNNVDLTDLTIAFNNSSAFVTKMTP